MIQFHLVPYLLWNFLIFAVRGLMSASTLKVIEYRRSFQPFRKDITTTVIIPVLIVGIMILKKDLNTPQPSIRAASSNDTGMLLKYGRRVTTINGTEPEATARAGAP